MQVRVKLVGVFKIDRFRQEMCDYPEGITVMEVARQLGLSEKILGIALINGVHSGFDSILQDGDDLTLMPILEGG
ncbi:hypothetical protein SAMN02745165_00743 [Malonomonas rubra DSM 5091]|uniref:TGS domain-containing protein n=1 Tax=Malonomonas rubra DSM 5091 TaxID=1122189 RepID=A0A1M6DN42_MALRU|nr:TGS domain-containing protein [Malonomonas rubra]SHI74581.1 hypothetical protein SAMN02745165_00743 [Malonomonas rubra DSM 5091]